MKSKQKLVFSGNNTQSWATILRKAKQQDFLEEKQMQAKILMGSDSKTHLKKIADSTYKLLEYAGYADSRKSVPDDNRDSINNSQQLAVYVN